MMKNMDETRNQIERALTDCPGMITRDHLAKFLGLSRRTLANKDSSGDGPRNPIRIGQRVLYEKNSVIEWLKSCLK